MRFIDTSISLTNVPSRYMFVYSAKLLEQRILGIITVATSHSRAKNWNSPVKSILRY